MSQLLCITKEMKDSLEAVHNLYKAALLDRDEAKLLFDKKNNLEEGNSKETLEVSYLGGESFNVEV